jgi:L-fuculose-phosphate aldolase
MLEDFKRIGRLLFQERLIDSHGGNMSVFNGEKILITRRDAMLGDLKDDDIIEVGLEPGEKDSIASRELAAHRALYKKKGFKAIVHAHPAAAIAISITDNKVVPQDAEGIFLFKAAPIVRIRDGVGSEETVRLLPSFLGNDNVVAMVKGHGSFAVGNSLEEAYKYTSALENSCRIIVAVRSMAGRGERKGGGERGRRGREKGEYKSAIPPGIGVMDRNRYRKR